MEGGHHPTHNNGAHVNSSGQNSGGGGMDPMHHYPPNMMPPNGAPLGVPPPGLFMPPPAHMMPPGGAGPNPYMMFQPPQGMPPQGVPQGTPGMMPPHMFAPKFDEEYEKNLEELNGKLAKIREEIEKMPRNDLEKFKDQKLPLARIKKIMKSDEDVRMISAEAPILFAKACEMFIIEMTHKAYYYASKNGRKTLQRNDIAAAITDTEIYDFLLDIMPRDEMINSNKDKQLSQYQLQLLDDVAKIQKMQTTQQQDQYLKTQIAQSAANPEGGSVASNTEEQKEGSKKTSSAKK